MKTSLMFLLFFVTFNIFADSPYDSLSVIAESGLIFRNEAKLNSKIISEIPFGTKIRRYYFGAVEDTVNNVINRWEQIEYKGVKGFVWGLYLSRHLFVDTIGMNQNVRLMREGYFCGEIAYSPNFFWYGIYNTAKEGIQEIRPVKIKMVFNKLLNEKEKKEIFHGDNVEEDGHMYFIGTDQNDTSDFLIGFKTAIDIKNIKGFTLNDYYNTTDKTPCILYPELPKSFSVVEDYSITFVARDIPIIEDKTKNTLSSRYTIFLRKGTHGKSEYIDEKNSINFGLTLPYMSNSAKWHVSRSNPSIIWYGDLDNDEKPDFIFSSNNMVEHGGWSDIMTLYLSSKANPKEILNKVSYILYWGCYG